MQPTGVVVMAYGSPPDAGSVAAYYTHIRRGRPPSAEQLDELVARYEAIGGSSPLAQRTAAQASAIGAALRLRDPGGFLVSQGNKHSAPFVEDAVADLAARGAGEVVGLVLAPHFSGAGVGEYHRRAAGACEEAGLPYTGIRSWHLLPAYVELLASSVREVAAGLPERREVLFTAHSLPERALVDDPYPRELEEGAAAVAERAGLEDGAWRLCWQSAGRTPEPWRGPDILEVVRELGEGGEVEAVLVCPHGFVADHLEVLYDVDVEAARVAREARLVLERTRSPNDDPPLMAALAELVAQSAGR